MTGFTIAKKIHHYGLKIKDFFGKIRRRLEIPAAMHSTGPESVFTFEPPMPDFRMEAFHRKGKMPLIFHK
jgi:hypothetical protein